MGCGVWFQVSSISNIYDDNRTQNTLNRLPTKHDIISCLTVGGRWVTSEANLQVCFSTFN